MHFNLAVNGMSTKIGNKLEAVDDFKYLGSWVNDTDNDIKTRKALAWASCNKMGQIWSSNLPRFIKLRLFKATLESVLLYG